ncbi:uncharacterized protein LOC114527618, partial [Dendronephthya gigantea]|uniref:uncharacterized protein LOC114527618 n=1 Tax=Dendronephthya gigantea TaxID=151771 RepID=UPI00106A8251
TKQFILLSLRLKPNTWTWSHAQRQRLAAEKSVLEHYFPGCVRWIDPTDNTKVEITLKTNNDNEYILRIYIGDFPNSVPDMVVVSSPNPMPDWGSSYSNHTLTRRDGYLRICHYHYSQWTDRSSLYEVVMKGRVWLEAYEGHLRTGQPMNYFLREMESSGLGCQCM